MGQCYLKSIDVSTPLQRVLTIKKEAERRLKWKVNWMSENEKF